MRNLKRALSLALASAMLIGMMVVGASAASYKDDAAVKNNEAVEVLTGIGVVGGDTNGNFNPEKTLTRAEFCVMIANALTGGKFDKELFNGASIPFNDAKSHWGASYIAYCYSVGAIAGTSATTFSPDGTLTAAQASAILLSALGYNQNNEFGANGQFALNVTRWAQQAGLYDGVSVAANAAITRDNAAKVIFNALTNTTPVGYSSLAESYYTVGSSAVSGVVYSGKDLDAKVSNATVNNHTNYYDKTLGYTNFGLEYGASASDDFNRPAHQWISDTNSDIGTYGDTPALTYTKDMKATDLEKALKGYKFSASTKSYTNGATGVACADETDLAALTAKGAVVEIYADKQNNITDVVVIDTFLAKVEDDYDAGDDEVTISPIDGAASLGSGENVLKSEDFALVADLKKDDYVMITVAGGVVKTVALPTVLENVNLSVVTAGKDVTVSGTKYQFNAKAATNNVIAIDGATVKAGDKVNVYLDSNNYVLGIEDYDENTSLDDYVFVKQVGQNGFEYIAKVVFTDGTTSTVTVSQTAAAKGTAGSKLTDVTGTTAGNCTNGNLTAGTFATYKTDKNGDYQLTYVATTKTANTTTIDPANGAKPINGVAYAGTTKTVFIAKDKAYTGVKSAPKVTTADYVYYTLDKGYLEAVYIGSAGKTTTNAAEVVYVLTTTPSIGKDEDDNTYYVYDVVMNGSKTTLTTNEASVSKGMYIIDSYTDGYADLTAVTAADKEYALPQTVSADSTIYRNGTLTVNGSAYTVADDVVVITIDTTDGNAVKTIGTSSINSHVKADKGFLSISLVLSSDDKDAQVKTIYMVK